MDSRMEQQDCSGLRTSVDHQHDMYTPQNKKFCSMGVHPRLATGAHVMEIRKSIQTFYGFILVKKSNGNICGRFPVTKKECTIGRDNGCDIRIYLNCVSAIHCVILFIDDKAYIRDKSLVGSTKVNGKKIGKNNFLLHQSDEIDICGKIFVWEYADLSTQPHHTSAKKFGITNDCKTPRKLERSLSQVITPLVPQDNNKITHTPAKSNTKSSKTLLSINNTPIVVASKNMSRLSYEEAKNSLKKQNLAVNSQSEPRLTSSVKSLSMVSGRNIPLFGDPKTTSRKSWVVTNALNDSSSSGAYVLGKLSNERLKRDSTPEFNSSYHYAEENVEFDSPDLSNVDLFDNEHVDELSINNPSNSRTESTDDDFQSDIIQNINLPGSESSTSRRDTYSLENGPIVVEQDSTPPPRRSILKCSKTTRPNRSRSNCRMVQFARLPLTDGRIKTAKSRFNKTSSFIVTDDVIDDTNISQESRKDTQFDVEYDDDLDGVQPLDSSVASLLNSPILDNSIVNRSSKRGSRGNKVMSLISSFEKRVNESPKNSIRASDLLSMSGSKHGETPSNNDSLNSNVSSARRINLENVFSAEDSKEQVDISVQDVEKTINSEANGLSNTLESEYTFSSPLNLHLEYNDNQKDKSNEEICSDDFEIQNNNSVLDEKSNGKVHNLKNISKFTEKPTIKENESLDVTEKQISDEEAPSMIIQSMAEMFNSNNDELEITYQQHKKSIDASFVFVENDGLQDRVNLKTSTDKNLVKNNSVSLSESLNKSLLDAIELQLDQMHDDKTNSFNSKKEETEYDSLLDKINNQTTTSDLISEETKITNTTNTSIIESGLSSKTKSLEISASNNAANSNVSESNENEAYSKKSADISFHKRNIRSSKIITDVLEVSSSRDTNKNKSIFDKSTNKCLPLEAAQSDCKKESNEVLNYSVQEEVIDLDNSKCILSTNNAKQLNTSVNSKNDMSSYTELKKRNTRSSKMISEVLGVSTSKDIYENEGNSEKTSNNRSTVIINDAASESLETTKSNNEEESNTFLNNSTEDGISDLDNSKQLNKSAKCKNDISTHAELKKRNTRSSKMISEVLGASTSKDIYENEGNSEKTRNNGSTLIINDAASESLETTKPNNEEGSNTFLNNSTEDGISYLDNSKQLNKSKNDISTHAELKKRNTRSSKMISEVLGVSTSKDVYENEGNSEKTSNNRSTLIINDAASESLETTKSNNEEESNKFLNNSTEDGISDLDNSKQLNKSTHAELKKRNTRSSKMISEVLGVSTSKDVYENEGNSEKTSNNRSTLIINDAASESLETTKSNNEEESNKFLNNSTEDGISDLDNSKQLNKSKNDISTRAELKKRNTRSSKMISKVLGVSTSRVTYENGGNSENNGKKSPISIVDNESTLLFETTSNNKKNNSKHHLIANNSKQLDKSVENDVSPALRLKNKNNCSFKKTAKVLDVSTGSDTDETKDTNTNLEHSSETSYGKPQYESTPWNSSKNSKIPLNSTSIQPNETTYANTPKDEQRQKEKSASVTPPSSFPNPEEWAIMMREFNESVKKASSCTSRIKTKGSNLFNPKPNHSQITVLVTTEKGVSSKYLDNETITPQIKNQNSIASCSSNNLSKQSSTIVSKSSPTSSTKRSIRATKKSPKAKKIKSVKKTEILKSSVHEDVSSVNNYSNTKTNKKSKSVLNTSSDDTKVKPLTNRPTRSKQITQETETKLVTASKKRNCHPSLPSPKINLRTRGGKNESITSAKKNTRVKKIVTDGASTASDTENKSSLRTRGRKDESNTSVKKNTRVKKIVSDDATTASDTENISSLRTRKGENESNTSAKKNTRVKKIIFDGTSTASDTENLSSLRTRANKSRATKSTKTNMSAKNNVSDGATTSSDTEEINSQYTRANKNGSGQSNKKNISDGASTGSDTETSSPSSSNKKQKSKKELGTKSKQDSAAKGTSKRISSIRANKNDIVTETNNSNINTAVKSRLTRSKTTLTESSLPKPDKKNKTSSPLQTKSVKLGKTIQTKKHNQKSQSVRFLPSKPLKTKTSELTDSSEYESASETEENVLELQIIKDQPTTSKEKSKKKDVQISKFSSSVQNKKNNPKEKISETSSNVLPQLSTRSRKRGADTPIFELNAKNSKKDISSKVPNTTMANVTNINHVSLPTKRTRNMSKESASQVSSNNSSLESEIVDRKENFAEKTKTKKREFGNDDSSNDLGPSTRKVTRKVAEKNNKNNTVEPNLSTKVTFKKNIKTSNSPKPKKTRSTKQAVLEVNTTSSPVPVRKLRTREKKK